MTLKEIAAKILIVMDIRENSFVKETGKYGKYTKTIRDSFKEVFGEEYLMYEPYCLATYYCWNDMITWANFILSKND